jgi:hypothetical protein
VRYVIVRDDDTNALTPPDCLERLYRPFLDRGLPVNLAVIPDVAADASTPDGRREGFLPARNGSAEHATEKSESARTIPIGSGEALVRYLLNNPGYHIAQHGCHHDYFEFERASGEEIPRRLEQGTRLLREAGFPQPQAFVAPHDRFSSAAFREVARRFRVISTGWFEARRLPLTWWPGYAVKKISQAPHWRVAGTTLLSHPGCLLSCHRSPDTMLDEIIHTVNSRQLTVLVTHWWEYFRDGLPNERFIRALHHVAHYLSTNREIKVLSFADLVQRRAPLN